jgi:hypothetical protein
MTIKIRYDLLVIVSRGFDRYRYGIYRLLILRDQLVVCSLGLICLVAVSRHNYLAWFRQGGLNPLTIGFIFKLLEIFKMEDNGFELDNGLVFRGSALFLKRRRIDKERED